MYGLPWSKGSAWDRTSGVGQQIAALEAVQSNLITQSKAPVTNAPGGTSKGDPTGGIDEPSAQNPNDIGPATAGDKAGGGDSNGRVYCLYYWGLDVVKSAGWEGLMRYSWVGCGLVRESGEAFGIKDIREFVHRLVDMVLGNEHVFTNIGFVGHKPISKCE
jgi:hypothetical protein